ncbi:MAG: hypothetical protein R3B90_22630 [Planctomycetaceae bacterium]
MHLHQHRVAAAIVTIALGTGIAWRVGADDEPRSIAGPQSQAVDVTIATDRPATLPTSALMHGKLVSNQQVLAGLVAEDFELISQSARDLIGLAREVPKRQHTDPDDDAVYEHFRFELLRLAADLQRMGDDRNLAGAAYVHGNLTATCIGCHQHLRSSGTDIELMGRRKASHEWLTNP